MTKKAKFSIRSLSAESGLDRATITRWLEGRTPRSRKEALAIIAEHPRAPTDSTPPFRPDMALLGHTLEHYVEHSRLCVRMIGILADAAAATSEAVAKGDLVGLDEDQAERLLAMLGEPWEAAKRLLPPDLLEAAEKEGA